MTTYSSNCFSMLLSCLDLDNISQVFRSWKIFLSYSNHFYRFSIAFFFQRFYCDTKLATLIGVGSSICGGSAITAPVIHAKEK